MILALFFGDPYQNRTGDAAVRGRSLNLLTNGPLVHHRGLEPRTHWLRVSCSTNWANGAVMVRYERFELSTLRLKGVCSANWANISNNVINYIILNWYCQHLFKNFFSEKFLEILLNAKNMVIIYFCNYIRLLCLTNFDIGVIIILKKSEGLILWEILVLEKRLTILEE